MTKEFYVDEAIIDICEALQSVGGKNNTEWTKNIKAKLAECAASFGLDTTPSEKHNWGEWLFDQCWVDARKDDYTGWVFNGFYLALESEWGTNYWELCADFDKLMIVRAPVRVMIFQNFKDHDVKNIAIKLAKRANAFSGSQTGDTYLFAGYNNDTGRFEFFTYSVGDSEPQLIK